MNTVTRNGQRYIVAAGEKLVNGKMVARDRLLWIGTEKPTPKVESKKKSERVLEGLIKSALEA